MSPEHNPLGVPETALITAILGCLRQPRQGDSLTSLQKLLALATMILLATGNEKYSGIPFNPMGKFVAAAHACLIFVPTSVQLIRQSTVVHMQAVKFKPSCKIM